VEPPDEDIGAIEDHFAGQGAVMRISPAIMTFGRPPPGARQYRVHLVTPIGMSQTYTVELGADGGVRTILV